MPVEITGADEISRCIIFDRAFDQDLHVDALLWRFESKTPDGVYHESAVLRRLAPQADDVHRIGCAIAATQNARKKEPEPGRKRRYYCGFRTASYASLPKAGEGFIVALTNVPEGGEDAHVDVAVTITAEGSNARANCRTNAGLALAEHFGPPASHRCECDLTDEHHPIALWGEDCLLVGLKDRWPSLTLNQDSDQPAAEDDPNQPKLIE